MATAVASTGFTQEAFDSFLSARDEPRWLIDTRRNAWRRFQELPLPSVRDEEWMRTDIRLFKFGRFRSPAASADAPSVEVALPRALLAAGVELGGQVTTSDSRPLSAELATKWSKQGVLFGSLDALVVEHGDLLRPYFERSVVDPNKDKFSALN